MNAYYFLTIFFMALSLYFGYVGTKYESKKSNDQLLSKIFEKFENLGQQRNELRKSKGSIAEVEEIDEKLKYLAQQYMKALPAKAQSLVVEQEANKLEQFNISNTLTPQINTVRETAKKVVAAFSLEGANIQYEDMSVPVNLFSNEPFRLRLQLSKNEYWLINLVEQEPGKIGIMFAKMLSQEYGESQTNDTIVFKWSENGRFFFSLNPGISEEVRRNVFETLDENHHPIAEANTQLETLVLNLVKYILAKSELKEAKPD